MNYRFIQRMRLLGHKNERCYNMARNLFISAESDQNFLKEHYEGRGIGRNGPIAWPPWSPDFNPSDFFLCRYVKSRFWHCGKQKVRRHLAEVQN